MALDGAMAAGHSAARTGIKNWNQSVRSLNDWANVKVARPVLETALARRSRTDSRPPINLNIPSYTPMTPQAQLDSAVSQRNRVRSPAAIQNAPGESGAIERRSSSSAWMRLPKEELMSQLEKRPAFRRELSKHPKEAQEVFLGRLSPLVMANLLMTLDSK